MEWIQRFKLKHKYGFIEKEIEKFKNLNESSLSGIEKRFISLAKYNELRNYLDCPSWRSILHNKWISAKYFCSYDIAQPKTYGFLHPIYGRTTEGMPLTGAKDLLKLVEEHDLESFVFKHIGGGWGGSVFVVDRIKFSNGTVILKTIDGQNLKKDDIQSILDRVNGRLKGYIVQERLKLHPDIKNITSGGLSSVRIYTFRDKTGQAKSCLALAGFGLSGRPTDHSTNGGIIAPIDCDSGLVSKGMQPGKSDEWISNHPESGITFEGFEVPGWDSVRKLAERAALRCPGLNWVGWDIIVTPDGPSLIEGNVGDKGLINSQKMFEGFLENGIYDLWMNNLELPEDEKYIYNVLKDWKTRYMKKILKKLIPVKIRKILLQN